MSPTVSALLCFLPPLVAALLVTFSLGIARRVRTVVDCLRAARRPAGCPCGGLHLQRTHGGDQ